MNHQDCDKGSALERIEGKLDTLESKLDNYHKKVIENKNDISWIKGSFKWATTVILAAIGFILTLLLKGH